MTISIIIAFCVLIIIAYLFDLSSSKSKIPTVILLLLLGFSSKLLVEYFNIEIPNLKPLLPVFGTIGLILIVLEGGLELQLNKSSIHVLKGASKSAIVPMVLMLVIFSLSLYHLAELPVMTAIVNVIPVCIISSAIAIPSVSNLTKEDKSFITYESSLSDIFGVILFNFFTAHEIITWLGVGEFLIQVVIVVILSVLASMLLAFLIGRINHHVKFLPIIVFIILLYALAKVYHLPALIFILAFGLAINNLEEIKHFKIVRYLRPELLEKESHKFKEIVAEGAFLVRTIFFILFGFNIDGAEILDLDSLKIAFIVIIVIFIVRWLYLKLMNIKSNVLLFVYPRGLITILLFLSIPTIHSVTWISETLMTQIILLSSFVMMVGLITSKTSNKL